MSRQMEKNDSPRHPVSGGITLILFSASVFVSSYNRYSVGVVLSLVLCSVGITALVAGRR